MKVATFTALAALFSLGACSEATNDTAVAVPDEQAAASEVDFDPIPVMGEEVRILAFGDSHFAGYGLKDSEGDSYPAKLAAALRARGVNSINLEDGEERFEQVVPLAKRLLAVFHLQVQHRELPLQVLLALPGVALD